LQDHPEYRQLVNAVRAAPDDDLPRLVLADWLEEHDAPEWAEFIRVHCEAARHPHAARIWADTFTDAEAVNPDWQRALTCARRVRELWPAVAEVICGAGEEGERAQMTWDGRCFFGDPQGTRPQFEVRRGFVEWVGCQSARWLDDGHDDPLGPLIVTHQPVREVAFHDQRIEDGPYWFAFEQHDSNDFGRPQLVPWRIAHRLRAERHERDELTNDVRHTWHYRTEVQAMAALSAAAIAWALAEAEQASGAT
jgi:uncharacterized protein (TIGR02996 family)